MFTKCFLWFLVILLEFMYLSVAVVKGNIVYLKLEGSASDHDARIGSVINITCYQNKLKSCGCYWEKDGQKLPESEKTPKRIEWIQNEKAAANMEKKCIVKLAIRNVTANDTGKYTCIVQSFIDDRLPENSIFVFAVPCFQGYFCPSKAVTAQRCPKGTFSMNKNATSVDDCKACPTHDSGDILSGFKPKTVAIFRKNCLDYLSVAPRGTAKLTGEIIAIGISAFVVFLIFLVAVYFRLRSRSRKADDETLFAREPEQPTSKDVFICYSRKNQHWVHNVLFPRLKEQEFQVFIDIANFEAGITIEDNIMEGIYGSRKTVFVLSKDSLKSYFARRELRQALIAGKTGHQVIVVLYEKCKVPAETTHLGDFLDWTDEKNRDKFWEQLYHAIRRPLPHVAV